LAANEAGKLMKLHGDRSAREIETMSTLVSAPLDWVESIGDLRLPSRADDRLQDLMDRNNEGELNAAERAELEVLVDLSQRLALVRCEALQLLGRTPQ
jgi:hypothetical protein